MHRRLHSATLLAAAAVTLAACDVGDGTTLQEPVGTTSLPPLDTTPLPSLPLDGDTAGDTGADGALTVDSVPLAELPTTPAPSPIDPSDDASDEFLLTAPWADGGVIDVRYTCDGSNAAPSLSWTGVPEGTAELAIALVDESNLSNGRPFIHWILAGIDPALEQIVEAELPPGSFAGINFFGDEAYTGPCPDPGSTNTYVLTLFAVGQQIELGFGTPGAELLDVVGTVALATSSVTGTVSR